MKKRYIGVTLVILSAMIMLVSAFVYESAQQTLGQTIVNVANITLQNSALGNLEEGETKSYTKADISTLGDAISTTTTKADVYMRVYSNIDTLSTYYSTYTLTVKYSTVPGGSSHTVGQTAATLTIAAPNATAVTLDAAGLWAFDFELTTTAKSVTTNQTTTAPITVTIEST